MHRFAKSTLLGLSLTAIFFTTATLAFTADVQKNEQAIREVMTGKRDVARAAWWGYDEKDATAALQAAIDSGAKKVIIEKMPGPWIVDKIKLVGDQELFFEPGVVIEAKKGAFHGRADSLFSAWNDVKNLKLIGPGATLRMHRDDYDNPKEYEKAEWRHAINLHGCENVTIEGLTIAKSGGDGIYLGAGRNHAPCRNVTIRDVVCDKNYRQGISVITAENLLIENCVLKNTAGTAPAAGIDFEPNKAEERLVNCVMRNCLIEDNEGYGIHLYLRPLNGTSKPVSMRIENCTTRGTNRLSASVITSCGTEGPLKGSIDFVNCRFEDQGHAGLNIQSKSPQGLQLRYIDCTIADPSDTPSIPAPIKFGTRKGDTETTGGVEFDNLTVCEKVERSLMAFDDVIGVNLKDITGKITVQRDGKSTEYRLTPEVIEQWIPFNRLLDTPIISLESLNLRPLTNESTPTNQKFPQHQLRSYGCYLIYASAEDKVDFRLKYKAVGKNQGEPMPVRILAPSGKEIQSITIKPNEEADIAFKANETGVFTVLCPPKQNVVQLLTSSHPACIVGTDGRFHLMSTTGDFYVVVPKDAQEFGLRLQGSGLAERLSAVVYDATGKVRWQKKNINHQSASFIVEREPSKQNEVWRLQVTRPDIGVLEDWYLIVRGIPAILGFDSQHLLKEAE